MARKRLRNDWPVIVYSYGVLPSFIKEHPKWLEEEARNMHQLWNKLVEIGRYYLDKYGMVIEGDPEIAPILQKKRELEENINNITKEIKELRKKLRVKKHSDINFLLKEKKKIESELKEIRKILREKKKKIKGKYNKIFEEMRKKVDVTVKEAPLYWGNKEVIRDRFFTAWVGVKRGHLPKFKRFDGNWLFTRRFSGGISVLEVLKKYFDRVPPEEAYNLPTRKRNKACKVHFTFDQGQDRKLSIPIIMHRPLPKDGYIKRFLLVRKEHGKDRSRWFVNIMVEVPPERQYVPVPENRKPLAVLELGFRKVAEEDVFLRMPTEKGKVKVPIKADVIRVGVLYDGKSFQDIYLPGKFVAKIIAASMKQSKADRLFQECKDRVREILLSEDVILTLPEELRKMVSSTQAWGRARKRALWKVVRLLKETNREELKDLAEDIRTTLIEWNWLMNVVARMKKKACGFRKKFYEKLAVDLFNKFETVVVPKIDLKNLSEEEQAEKLPDKARFQRFYAALYEFRMCLERRAEKTGSVLEIVDFPYKTRLCHVCGTVNEPEDRSSLYWTCEGCGRRWDQDENAAVNLWKEYLKQKTENS